MRRPVFHGIIFLILSLSAHGIVTTFTALPFSAPEIGNPMRGLYGWGGGTGGGSIVDAPMLDRYRRFTWNELESGSTPGAYDFRVIDDAITAASNAGACFNFRVRCYVPSGSVPCGVPAYVSNASGGFKDIDGIYVPDWNNAYFLERADRLIEALGARYNSHPYISFIDIGIYGMWGEWHMSGFPYPGPHGEQRITSNNAYRIIDTYARCFSNVRLVFRVNNDYTRYAMEKYPRMGCRADSVANPGFDSERTRTPWMTDRWKRAPFICETWSPDDPGTSVYLAAEDITNYHIAMLGNGNLDLRTTADTNEFIRAGKLLGHRFEAVSAAFPSVITQCTATSISSLWKNSGVTPAYIPWAVKWRLRTSFDAIAFECTSALDLTRLMPTVTGPVCINDCMVLPSTVPPGTYTLELIIADPALVRKPLTLAVADTRSSDGSYRIGSITVAAFPGTAAERSSSYAFASGVSASNSAYFASLQENALEQHPAAAGPLFDTGAVHAFPEYKPHIPAGAGAFEHAVALYRLRGAAVTFMNIPEDTGADVYSLSGCCIAKREKTPDGTLAWDFTADSGRRVTAGVYLCRLRSASGSKVIKIMVLE